MSLGLAGLDFRIYLGSTRLGDGGRAFCVGVVFSSPGDLRVPGGVLVRDGALGGWESLMK